MRVYFTLALLTTVTACEAGHQGVPAASTEATVSNTPGAPSARLIPADVSYAVISEDVLVPHKRSLDVRLNQRVSEDVLRAIAHELRDHDARQYQRTFIVYYLPGMEVGAGGWATTHFDPTLRVVVQGLTREEELALSSDRSTPGRDVIGRWLDDSPFVGSRLTLYRAEDQLSLERHFPDGSTSSERLRERSTPSGRRFDNIGNSFGEYYLLDPQGNLQIWDSDGLITTAQKLE